jgi:hypothetical protein
MGDRNHGELVNGRLPVDGPATDKAGEAPTLFAILDNLCIGDGPPRLLKFLLRRHGRTFASSAAQVRHGSRIALNFGRAEFLHAQAPRRAMGRCKRLRLTVSMTLRRR